MTLPRGCFIIIGVGGAELRWRLAKYSRFFKKMSEIRVGENETLESALRRFKRKCARAGVLAEIRKREHYEKPSVKRKKKAEAARKRKH